MAIESKNESMTMSSISSSQYFDAYQTEEELKYFENIKILEFLNDKCSDIEKLVKLFPTDDIFNIQRFQNKKIVVKGYVQSGKTNFIISLINHIKNHDPKKLKIGENNAKFGKNMITNHRKFKLSKINKV